MGKRGLGRKGKSSTSKRRRGRDLEDLYFDSQRKQKREKYCTAEGPSLPPPPTDHQHQPFDILPPKNTPKDFSTLLQLLAESTCCDDTSDDSRSSQRSLDASSVNNSDALSEVESSGDDGSESGGVETAVLTSPSEAPEEAEDNVDDPLRETDDLAASMDDQSDAEERNSGSYSGQHASVGGTDMTTCWPGFLFQSFNAPLPSEAQSPSEAQMSSEAQPVLVKDRLANNVADKEEAGGYRPPGFSPCRSLYKGCQSFQLRRCVEEPIDQQPLTSDVPIRGLDRRIGIKWSENVVPKLLAEEVRWRELSKLATPPVEFLRSPQAATLAGIMTHYVDLCFLEQTYLNALTVRALIALHVLNHVMQSRAAVTGNNRSLKAVIESTVKASPKKQLVRIKGRLCEKRMAVESQEAFDPSGDDRFRDQGYVRAKILILTPTKQSAKDFIDLLINLLPKTKQVGRRKRYEREFSAEDTATEAERNAIARGDPLVKRLKPPDFIELFRGNNSDEFRIGIAVHSNSSATLYAPFYQSDIIVASPLGLRLVIGTEGEKRDFDFLSSIEVLVMDRADVLMMQSWEHVRDILEVTNVKPLKWRQEWDIRRLRNTNLEDLARRFRQTIVTSSGRRPEISGMFSGAGNSGPLCCNFRGGIPLFNSSDGSIARNCAMRVAKQLFLSVPCNEAIEISQSISNIIRLEFPFPFLSVSSDDSILLVCPSYLEYLRLRKVLRSSSSVMKDPRELHRFASCHEYIPDIIKNMMDTPHTESQTDVTERCVMFHDICASGSIPAAVPPSGQVKLMVTTERYLFFRRPLIKGANHVVFLGPPQTPGIYVDCLKALQEPKAATSCVLYTRFHALGLERIVGPEKLRILMAAPRLTSKLFVLG